MWKSFFELLYPLPGEHDVTLSQWYKLWYRFRFDLSFYMRVIAIISNDPIESHNTQQEAM